MASDHRGGPTDGSHDGPLPGSARRVRSPVDRCRCRSRAASVRRVRHRHRPDMSDHGPRHPRSLRGLQTLARSTARPARHLVADHDLASPRTAAHLLRTHHRMGLQRRPSPGPDLRGRLPQPRRTPPEVPRRPHRREVHGRPRDRPEPAPTTDGRDSPAPESDTENCPASTTTP